ncbi:MAG: ATP-binding protein, partial [Oscillospiraceae bacterium]|nr:ATP-binding protein [Oscillospiraceae bacterium]
DGTLSCEKCASLLKLAFERGSVRYEWYYKTSDGTPIPCEEILERIKIGDRDYLLVYIRDLREEKALLAELVDALNNEQAANRANKQFLTKMSHEIRTPLNAVLGIAEIQLQKSVNPPEMEEAFSRIHRSASMLRSLIDDILDLAKVEAEKMEIFSNAYELVSLIVDTVQLNLMNIGSKRIEFSLKVEDELPSSLIGDELRIKQILNNLLSNAFKYTLEGTVSLSFSMESAPEFDDVVMTICVSDSGRGMTDEQIDKLFDSGFKRFNVEDNRQIEGVGLGMSITHSLVKMMRGSISVKSKKGRGSSFTVKIPQKRQGNAVLGKEVVESLENLELTQRSLDKIAKLKNEPMPYGRVLVVDDVESNLYVIKGFLVLYKISVETVSSGYAAIEKVAAGEIYDIIFMDHMMPGMDGFETVRIIRDMGYGYPIVALTANAIKGASEMFLSKGFDGFISKPIDITLLNDHLLHYIKDKQSPEVIEAARLEGSEVEGLDDSMQNLVRSFLLDAEKAVKTLESLAQVQELNDDALKSIVIQAHAMKSALHNIGCKELSEEAYALEKMNPAATDMQIIKARTEQFLNGLQELVSELAQKIAPDEYSNCDAADDDPELLREKLTAIAQACDSFDYDAASNVLDELKKQCSKKIGELLRDIETYLISGGFEEAADLANKAVAELEWHTKVAKG